MRVFQTKWFARWARKQGISMTAMVEAAARADKGLIDADLGGGLIKQRVARRGQGRSAGFRMLVGYRKAERAVFLYGFGKSERDDIDEDELLTWRKIGADWLGLDERQVGEALADGALREIKDGEADDAQPDG